MRSYFLNKIFKVFFVAILCLSTFLSRAQQVAFQGFEGTASDNWGFTSSPSFYDLGADFWEIRTSTPQIPVAYDGNFVGGQDLRNANNSTGLTILTFDAVAITTKVDVRFRFQYVGYDNADYIQLEVAYDNGSDWSSPDAIVPINVISQTDDSDGWEEASHTVLAGPTHVRARLVIFQNGSDDIGVDAFEVVVNTDPDPVVPPLPTYAAQFGSGGSGNGQFSFAEGVAVHPVTGDIWVADKSNNRIQIFNSAGVYQSQFGSTGSGNGQFNNSAMEIKFDASGNAWVVDRDNHRIQKFSSTGSYLSQFGSNGTGNGQLNFPEGIAIHPTTGDLWVADKNNERVQIFNSSGVYQSQFGSEGTGDGQFNASGAIDLDFDASGNVWVVDQSNHRVQKFNSAGVYQSQLGSIGGDFHELLFPSAVAVHPNGDIWIADKNNEAVKIYNSSGVYVNTLGSIGTGNGQFGSNGIVDIAFDAAGDAWVLDNTDNRLQKFDVDFASAPSSVTVAATVFLEGAYNGTNLNTSLNTSIPANQPYAINGHNGGENAGTIPANAVDWVLVELREAGSAATALSSTKVGSAAGFLLEDGTIKATDGSGSLTISLDGNSGSDFFVVVYHRNHLAIMSANAVSDNGSGIYEIDFTTLSGNTYQTTSALTTLATGKFAMPAGDADGDGDVDATDLATWQNQNGKTFTYNSTNGDFNLDGEVNAVDRNDFQQKNSTKTSQVPTT